MDQAGERFSVARAMEKNASESKAKCRFILCIKQGKDYLRIVHKLVWLTMLQNQKPRVDSIIAKTSFGNLKHLN